MTTVKATMFPGPLPSTLGARGAEDIGQNLITAVSPDRRKRGGGRRFCHRKNKEVFVAEIFAILRALTIFDERNETGANSTALTDSTEAMRRAAINKLGSGQALVRAVVTTAQQPQAENA